VPPTLAETSKGVPMTRPRLSARLRLGVIAAGAVVLAACGGGLGELLLAALVTPLNGAWRLDGDVTKEGLRFLTPGIEVQFFSSRYDVTATMQNPSSRCNAPDDGSGELALVGTFDDGRIVLRARDAPNRPVCIEGTITTLIRLDAVATGTRPARFYENSRVDVQMGLGLWVSEGGATRIKFSDVSSVDNDTQGTPIRACDVSPQSAPAVLNGLLDGYQKATQKRPFIAALAAAGQATPRYTNVEYVDGATIALRTAGGAAVTLRRTPEATPTQCPPQP
jgi:hypothetical protein